MCAGRFCGELFIRRVIVAGVVIAVFPEGDDKSGEDEDQYADAYSDDPSQGCATVPDQTEEQAGNNEVQAEKYNEKTAGEAEQCCCVLCVVRDMFYIGGQRCFGLFFCCCGRSVFSVSLLPGEACCEVVEAIAVFPVGPGELGGGGAVVVAKAK